MRAVDLMVLCLCGTAVFLSIQSEGDYSLVPSWYHEIDATSFNNGVAPDISERLPRPIITDLDGDGTNEIVLATREPKILVLKYSSDVPDTDTWSSLEEENSASLLSSVSITKGRQPVALSVGYLDAYSPKRARHQYIVVVTEGWNVLCFDHKLNLKWERSVDADVKNNFLNEVAVLVTSHAMQVKDHGAVIVGGRLQNKDDPRLYTMHDVDAKKALRGSAGVDTESEDEDDDGDDDRLRADKSHFSYYAFEGESGKIRWKHDAGDFAEPVHAADVLHPQHEAHAGQVDWRNFRSSVMDSLPHQWSYREDTLFALAHYEHRRSGKDRTRHQKVFTDAIPHTHRPGFNGDSMMPHTADEHINMPNTLVAHLRDGVEVIHLFSGRPVCQLSLKTGDVHADINGDGVIDHVEAIAGINTPFSRLHTSNSLKVPRCMSMVTSAVPPSHQLFNGSICPVRFKQLLHGVNLLHANPVMMEEEEEGADVMVANPTIIQHFDGGDVHHTHDQAVKRKHRKKLGAHKVKTQTFRSHANKHSARTFDSVFLISSGLITSYNPKGQLRWQRDTDASWSDSTTDASSEETQELKRLSLLPSVNPYRLRPHGRKDHIIAAGESHMVVMSGKGEQRVKVKLPDVPVSTPVIGDFDNDGMNDVILVTPSGYYGYQLQARAGARLFTVLVGLMVLASAFTLVLNISETQQNKGSARVARGRYKAKAQD